jgi:hypothetical protein
MVERKCLNVTYVYVVCLVCCVRMRHIFVRTETVLSQSWEGLFGLRSEGNDCEGYCFVGFDAVLDHKLVSLFRRKMHPPSSGRVFSRTEDCKVWTAQLHRRTLHVFVCHRTWYWHCATKATLPLLLSCQLKYHYGSNSNFWSGCGTGAAWCRLTLLIFSVTTDN